MLYALNWLGRLTSHAVFGVLWQLKNVLGREHHVERVQVTSQAADFDVVSFADNDGMKTGLHKRRDGAMRMVHKRAGCLHYLQTSRLEALERPFRGTVGRDHHA